MKISISLSDEVGSRLADYARTYARGNASLVVDLALRRLFAIPMSELPDTFWSDKLDRLAATRTGWRKAFWHALARMMAKDDSGEDAYVPRNYGDHYVVILRTNVGEDDRENDPFYVHTGPAGGTTVQISDVRSTFKRAESPINAARQIAERLR
ncbi:MAG TPA: hypothetical protein VGF18_00760, partial [Candidatus Tumulicola sp.]|jgi:hypothetical protein